MKTLKFYNDLVPLILSGQKTVTWRLFDDKNLQTGDELILINKQTMEEFTKAKITKMKEVKFKELTDKDREGHEKFYSDEKMYQTYSKYYDKPITEETKVKIIHFKLSTI